MGTLRDISLLAALLELPPMPDEDREERPALAQAMEKIAERHGSINKIE